MLNALLNILNGLTDIPFVELAWTHSPDDKYGVITLNNQIALNADADPVTEKMLSGFVDVFVKKPQDLSTVNDVESALKQIGIWFALESVQFEDDTGYVHYEWQWRDTLGVVASNTIYVARFFVDDEQIADPQIVIDGDVEYPVVNDYTDGGLTYVFASWQALDNRGNIDYVAQFGIYVEVIRVLRNYIAQNKNATAFTDSQIGTIVEWFNGGNAVLCYYNNRSYNASAVTSESVKFQTSIFGTTITAEWG